MSEPIRYDIAILGTGPAGISAAITAKIRNKNIILFGDRELSRKLALSHTIDNYPGLPRIAGADLADAFRAHLDALEIPITEDRISAIYDFGGYYALQGKGENYEASCVILACGVVSGKPFPGENENLGRGVSYCATCDAALYRGKTAIVLGYSAKEEDEAAFLAEVADKVTYLPIYEAKEGSPEAESLARLGANPKIEIVSGVKPSAIQGIEKTEGGMTLRYGSDETLSANGIFILREAISPDQLVPGLATEGSAVACDRQMRTNLPGIFVCGDIAGPPYQDVKAAGEGNVAALSAVSYLAELAKK